MPADILVVDDEAAIADLVELYLKNEGFAVHKFESAAPALAHVEHAPPDLAILDVMLPGMDGFTLCRTLREKYLFPILMLTARVEDMDKITGLTLGADDYITKPFSLAVLRARVANILRRQDSSARIAVDGFVFDFETLSFTRGGEPLELSKTEQKVLQLLVRSRGSTVPRERLLDRVWGDSDYVDENALSVTIRRLRSKLEENPGAPRYIKTVYGIGYTWAVKP